MKLRFTLLFLEHHFFPLPPPPMEAPPHALAQAIEQAAAPVNAGVVQVVTREQLAAAVAPLVSRAELSSTLATFATREEVAALRAQVDKMQAQVAGMEARMVAAMHALLAQHDAPRVAATAAATVQAIVGARMRNAHDEIDKAYVAVPRSDGTIPPHWPAAFDREALMDGPIGPVDLLIADYGLQPGPGGDKLAKRNLLAVHIGTTRR
jgi:hypothetical protein